MQQLVSLTCSANTSCLARQPVSYTRSPANHRLVNVSLRCDVLVYVLTLLQQVNCSLTQLVCCITDSVVAMLTDVQFHSTVICTMRQKKASTFTLCTTFLIRSIIWHNLVNLFLNELSSMLYSWFSSCTLIYTLYCNKHYMLSQPLEGR